MTIKGPPIDSTQTGEVWDPSTAVDEEALMPGHGGQLSLNVTVRGGAPPPEIEYMTDSCPPSRLELLAFAERVAEQHLAQVRRWKAAEERRVAERLRCGL